MAVKRRRSKQRLTPVDEMKCFAMLFSSGFDFMDEIDEVLDPHRPPGTPGSALGDLSPTEREAVILDAWRRLGGLFLESAEYELRAREDPDWEPWALLKYGPPG